MTSAIWRLFWLAWMFICVASTIDWARDNGPTNKIACGICGALLAFNLATKDD